MRNDRPVGIPRRRADIRSDPAAEAEALAAVAAAPTDELRRHTRGGYGPFESDIGGVEVPFETVLAEVRRRKVPGSRQSRRAARQAAAKRGVR